jgi:hypothetical protein
MQFVGKILEHPIILKSQLLLAVVAENELGLRPRLRAAEVTSRLRFPRVIMRSSAAYGSRRILYNTEFKLS